MPGGCTLRLYSWPFGVRDLSSGQRFKAFTTLPDRICPHFTRRRFLVIAALAVRSEARVVAGLAGRSRPPWLICGVPGFVSLTCTTTGRVLQSFLGDPRRAQWRARARVTWASVHFP